MRQHNALKGNPHPPTIAETLHVKWNSNLETIFRIWNEIENSNIKANEKIQILVSQLNIPNNIDLSTWSEEQMNKIVDSFITLRFPTILCNHILNNEKC